MSLQYDDQLMLAGESSRHFQAVGLNFRNAQSGQTRHFPRMRSNDEDPFATVQLSGRSFKGIQRVGIHNYIHVDDRRRAASLDDDSYKFGGLGIAGDARAECERLVFQRFVKTGAEL